MKELNWNGYTRSVMHCCFQVELRDLVLSLLRQQHMVCHLYLMILPG